MAGFRIASDKLKQFRKRAKLTQEELAALADCSDRVVRKAEAGGSLRYETILSISTSLTSCGVSMQPDDLIAANLLKAKQFVEAMDRGLRSKEHFDLGNLSEELELNVAGHFPIIPFAGIWVGRSGLKQFLNRFCQLIERDPTSVLTRYSESEEAVVASRIDLWQFDRFTPIPVWCNFHFHFKKETISRIDFQYDTLVVYQTLADLSKPVIGRRSVGKRADSTSKRIQSSKQFRPKGA